MPPGIIQAFHGSSRKDMRVERVQASECRDQAWDPAEPLTPCSVLWGSDSTFLTLNVLCRAHQAWALSLGKLPIFQ